MAAYYNENDLFAAEWLRNLILAGLIADGEVDTRSIEDVTADDLKGFNQCHFFAGIGVWSHALRNAGWPDDRVVWTGSCPCQPFSAAGKRGGTADERHLWPAFFHLIDECRPPVVLGEQVASKDGLAWLDLVSSDLEGAGYAFGAVDTCAAGFGAPHIRQRLYFVGIYDTAGSRQFTQGERAEGKAWDETWLRRPECGRQPDGLADTSNEGESRRGIFGSGQGNGKGIGAACERLERLRTAGSMADTLPAGWSEGRAGAGGGQASSSSSIERMADPDGRNTGTEGLQRSGEQRQQQEDGSPGRMGDTAGTARERDAGQFSRAQAPLDGEGIAVDGPQPVGPEHAGTGMGERPGPLNGFWRDADWLLCRDGKWRPAGPGTFPLVNGAPARVGRLRAYGNALNAEVAGGFVEAVMDALGCP